MEEQYRKSGLKVIWIGFQDKKEKIVAFLEKHGVRSSLGYDLRDRISRKYGISYGAGIVLIDREGIVRKRVPKGVSEKVLLESVEFVLNAPPARIEQPRSGSRRAVYD